MKEIVTKVFSFIKRILLFLNLQVHVKVEVQGSKDKDEDSMESSNDLDVK